MVPLCFGLRDGSGQTVDGLMAFLADAVEPVQFGLEGGIQGGLKKADHGLMLIRLRRDRLVLLIHDAAASNSLGGVASSDALIWLS